MDKFFYSVPYELKVLLKDAHVTCVKDMGKMADDMNVA